MREFLNRKELSKPLFIFMSSLILIVFFMLGMLSILKLRLYSSVVTGSSMEKTLTDGTKILLINANLSQIKRGDIVSVDANDPIIGNFHYLKRVIGLPNDKVKIEGANVYINGELLEEPYAYYSKECNDNFTFQLSDTEYFIMGDNRCNSEDSRHIGPVKKDSILSVIFKYKK